MESTSYGFMLRVIGRELTPRGQIPSRKGGGGASDELMFDQCKTLGDKWLEGAAGPLQTLTLLSAMEADIIITL